MSEETVSAEELDAALEKAKADNIIPPAGNEPVEPVEPMEPVEPPKETEEEEKRRIEHSESSRLGRKVKWLEEQLEELKHAKEKEVTPKLPSYEDLYADNEEDEDDSTPLTRREMLKLLENREIKKKALDAEYVKNYTAQLVELSLDLDESEAEKVMEIFNAKYNSVSDKDPRIAAKMNFREAQVDYLTHKTVVPTSPFDKRKQVNTPSGVSGGGEPPVPKGVTVDAETLKLATDLGLTPEQATEALSRKK